MSAPLPPVTLVPVTLVLGGARSGKSRHAESLVEGQPGPCVYLATAEARDGEMAARIAAHRARRGRRWSTLEAPLDLVAALGSACGPDRAVLVDCLTLWLSNLMGTDKDVAAECDRLIAALPALAGPVVFVSNEVGQGVVPDNELARAFVDRAGRLHQDLAAVADRVVFMNAGLPGDLKTPSQTQARVLKLHGS
ncbi:MAG: bifunctional adenosylcobinamide kinase/adenosylcobinamide-phosphate guanylyltransferase [Proteobacteria bacterium]|nr:bifunctional adenosylcobinamide kinase/adenosylcobinamide-phosphate guanylyltransferase [Pseudomonadota bacterium]